MDYEFQHKNTNVKKKTEEQKRIDLEKMLLKLDKEHKSRGSAKTEFRNKREKTKDKLRNTKDRKASEKKAKQGDK